MALPLLVSTRFQVLLTPLAGVLFTFPSRYWFTIGRRRVFSLATWSSQIPAGFHVSRGTQVPATSLTTFTYGALTLYGPSFQNGSVSGSVAHSPALNRAGPTTPMDPKTHRFGLFRVRSPLLTKSLNCFLFLQVLRWFTSLSSLPKAYEFSSRILHFQRSRFPHSDIFGSTPVCGSPKLFAAYHVLHRLPSPRHPPYALSSLIITCLWRSLYDS